MTLIPALTKLFGKGSWYLPKWLGSILPELDIEGKALEQDSHQAESHASTDEDRHGAYATDRRGRDDRDFESEHPSRLDRQYHRD
ncbi:hypothetical protein CRN61_09730, partial [Vibrio vulnificus]